jgi:NAD(P)-dependent dehydrogenase (short-subunit alcohol dehydrogenase family)
VTIRLGLEGRGGLVIGGTSELGGACVQRLCEEGMEIVFTGADPDRGEAIAQLTGCTFLACDPGDRAAGDRMLERALTLLGNRLDVLVANSDKLVNASIEGSPDEEFRALLEWNLTWPFRIARACVARMRAAGGGSVIHVASADGIRADHETAAHSVASAGVIALSELLAAEGAVHGIRANVVCPSTSLRVPPSGRRVTGADVASVVAWLASEESGHVTGATLRLDGGEGAAMLLDTRGA